MKLLKKLLPLATVASTAAIVAPMVTSCGGGLDMVDLSKKFEPTIAQYQPKDSEAAGVSDTTAKNIYLTETNKNKNIVKEDVYWFLSNLTSNGSEVPQKIGLKVNKVDTSKETVDYEFKLVYKVNKSDEGVTLDMDMEIYTNITNAKCNIKRDGDDGWYILLGSSPIAGDQQIKGKMTGHYNMTMSGKSKSWNFTSKEHTINKDTTIPETPTTVEEAEISMLSEFSLFDYQSYFLQKLKSDQK